MCVYTCVDLFVYMCVYACKLCVYVYVLRITVYICVYVYTYVHMHPSSYIVIVFYVCIHHIIVASSDSVVNSIMQPDPLTDSSTTEFGSKEVCDILKAKGMKVD